MEKKKKKKRNLRDAVSGLQCSVAGPQTKVQYLCVLSACRNVLLLLMFLGLT